MTSPNSFDFLPTSPEPEPKSGKAFWIVISVLTVFILGGGGFLLYKQFGAKLLNGGADTQKTGVEALFDRTETLIDNGQLATAENVLDDITSRFGGDPDVMKKMMRLRDRIAGRRLLDNAVRSRDRILTAVKSGQLADAQEQFAAFTTKYSQSPAEQYVTELTAVLNTEQAAAVLLNLSESNLKDAHFQRARDTLDELAKRYSDTFAGRQAADVRKRLDAAFADYDSRARAALEAVIKKQSAGRYSEASADIAALKAAFPESSVMDKVSELEKEITVAMKQAAAVYGQLVDKALAAMRHGDFKSAGYLLDSLEPYRNALPVAAARLELAARSAITRAQQLDASNEKEITDAWQDASKAVDTFAKNCPKDRAKVAADLQKAVTREFQDAIRAFRAAKRDDIRLKLLTAMTAAVQADDFLKAYSLYNAVADKPDDIAKDTADAFNAYRLAIRKAGFAAERALAVREMSGAPKGLAVTQLKGLIFKKPIPGGGSKYREVAGYLVGMKNDTGRIVLDVRLRVVFVLQHKIYDRTSGKTPLPVASVTETRVVADQALYYPALNGKRETKTTLPGDTLALVMAGNAMCPGHFKANPKEYFVSNAPESVKILSVKMIEADPQNAPKLIVDALRARCRRIDQKQSGSTSELDTASMWALLEFLWDRGFGVDQKARLTGYYRTDPYYKKIMPARIVTALGITPDRNP